MTNRDDLLRRVTITNPVPGDVDLPDDLADSRPPVALLIGDGAPTSSRPKYPNTQWWRGPAVAAAAALAVVVAISVPLLFGSTQEGASTSDTAPTIAPTTLPPPPPTTVVPATVTPIVPTTPMTWTRVVDAVAFGGDDGIRIMTDAAAADGIVVAVGADEADRGLFFDAAVWYSLDGVAWNRVPHDEAVFGGDGHQRMNAVVALESGFIAVGSDGDQPGAPAPSYPESSQDGSSETHAAVWRSDDGIRWTRLPHSDAFSEPNGGAVMNDVIFDGSGLVAVGLAYHQTEPFATYRWGTGDPSTPSDVDIDVDAAVWRSIDGVVWNRVTAEDQAFGSDTIRQHMNAVVAGGPGFVAVGQEGFDYLGFDEWTPIQGNNPDGDDHVTDNVAAVWTSPDGETWTRVADEPSLAHSGGEVTGWAVMFDVAANGSSLVAVGRDLWDSTPTNALGWMTGASVWLSPDGLSWQKAAVGGEPHMLAVTSTGRGGLVAGGGPGVLGEPALTWTSQDDGNTWVSHPSRDKYLFGGRPTNRAEDEAFGAASIRGLSTFGANVLAVGMFNDDAAVWVGTWNGGSDG